MYNFLGGTCKKIKSLEKIMSLDWQDKHPQTPKETFFLPLFPFVVKCSLLSKDIFEMSGENKGANLLGYLRQSPHSHSQQFVQASAVPSIRLVENT